MSKPRVPEWLRTAIFYQIYPQSYYDSNGDGIGDLPGITKKLDHIKSLGCDAIWLNPCFVSPFADAGYDVADFYKVDPRYGTNADLKRLFQQAKKRGIRICLDLVAGHTSVEHPWFKASCNRLPNKYWDWYIWTKMVWDVGDPAKTRIVAGYAQRDGNYVTNFFWCQPALNYGFAKVDPKRDWQHKMDAPGPKAVLEEMKKIMRFWVKMGAAGFRVDMAPSLVKVDKNQQANMALWTKMRRWFEKAFPEGVLISEWDNPSRSIPAGFHIDFMLPFSNKSPYAMLMREGKTNKKPGICFFDKEGTGNIRKFLDPYLKHYRKSKKYGYISLPTANHDFPRIRTGRELNEVEIVYAMLMTMPGIPFIYYGDEIGMRFLDELPSKEGGYGRTGTRTPMQWTRGRNAGFSTAAANKLYLPIDPRRDRPTVEVQEKDPESLLNTVRRMIALRRRIPALGSEADFTVLYAKARKYPFVYLRSDKKARVLVAVNPCKRPVKVVLNARIALPGKKLMGRGQVKLAPFGKGKATLQMGGLSYAIIEV